MTRYYRRWNEPKTKLFENKEEKKEAYSSGKVKPDVLATLPARRPYVKANAAPSGASKGGGEPLATPSDVLSKLVPDLQKDAGKKGSDDDAVKRHAAQAEAGAESPPVHGRRLQVRPCPSSLHLACMSYLYGLHLACI